MSSSVGFVGAFLAGVISFLSPCVLPLIPGYLSFMTGLTASELSEDSRPLGQIMGTAVLFVVGFSVVFVVLGASASVLGQFLTQYRDLIEKIAGLVVILFGVFMLGVVKIPWLYGEARMDLARSRRFGRGAALVMGMAFAAGWTPCVGPILGVILTLAASTGSVSHGALLLFAYSLGLGVPFLLVALLFGSAKPVLSWLTRHSVIINRVAGATLIVIGVLIFSGRLTVIASWLSKVLPTVGI
jgi:cytochrome c-type biogenesis protein